jgi:hypothetical protein
MAVHCRLGSLHVNGCSGLNLNKTNNIVVPADQVDFSPLPRRAVVPGHDDVTQPAEMEVSVFLAAPASALMLRLPVRGQSVLRQPVKAADGCVRKAA